MEYPLIGYFLVFPICANATAYTMGWDCVDSGKHCDIYINNSSYKSKVWEAKDKWNEITGGVIRKWNIFRTPDVSVEDICVANGTLGVTYSSGLMQFNTYYLEGDYKNCRLATCLHELGHALGCAHSTVNDVMYRHGGQVNNKTLTKNDKDSYNTSATRY